MTRESGPLLRKPAFERRIERKPKTGDRLSSAAFQAQHYRGLAVRESGQPTTIYAAPTSAGVVTVACLAPSGGAAAARDYDRAAATVRNMRGKPVPLAPSRRYAAAVDQ